MQDAPRQKLLSLWNSEQFRFLLIGVWNTLFGYGLFVLGDILVGHAIHYVVIAALVHVIAVTQSFFTQRNLVFRSAGNPWLEYLRFHVSYLGVLAFGLVSLPVLVELGGLSPRIAQGILILVSALASYGAHKFFSFKGGTR